MTIKLILGSLLAALPATALAHHPLQGQPMETFLHGLLSGMGHPLLGFDHLFFVIALGLLALLGRSRILVISAYLIAMAIGCLLRLRMPDMPLAEWVVASSLVVAGGLLALAKLPTLPRLIPLLAGLGFFHGAAFGVSLTVAEATAGSPVLLGYLTGLIAIQSAIAWVAGGLAQWRLDAVGVRLAGAMVAGAGVLLLLEASEPALLALIA